MRNSKITILIKIVVFVAIFVLIVSGLNAIVEPSTFYPWQVLPFLYQHNDIDTVFVGSSVVFDSNIPLAVNETSGLNVCNLSTPLQTMMASYFSPAGRAERQRYKTRCAKPGYHAISDQRQ